MCISDNHETHPGNIPIRRENRSQVGEDGFVPRFLSAKPDSRLLPLPWDKPLAEWDAKYLVALPRGISRHVVRFIKIGDEVYAAKEVIEHLAVHEYRLLHDLNRLGTPSVEPLSVVTGRVDENGQPLDPVLITKHLQFALPYRSLFTPGVRKETVQRLLDALVVLIARLHITGFMWGDISLSNTLFRRDAEQFAAYLVDAETGELHDILTDGQRNHDLSIARTNLFGDFCDLQAGGLLDPALDPVELVDYIETRYHELWRELTAREQFSGSELDRIEGRVRRLNALGFDIAELDIQTSEDGNVVTIQPKVVDVGYHSRRLMRLTGLDTEEYQARRLLNDLDTFRAATNQQNVDEAVVAHQWLTEVFEPVIAAIPPHLQNKRERAQIYHEVLDYRWYQAQREYREVPMYEAVHGYIQDVLSQLPDEVMPEETIITLDGTKTLLNPLDPSMGFVEEVEHEPFVDPWEQNLDDVDLTAASRLDIDSLRKKKR